MAPRSKSLGPIFWLSALFLALTLVPPRSLSPARAEELTAPLRPVADTALPTAPSASQRVDLVFAMDTSGSMDDEFSALCSTIADVVQELQSQGIDLTYRILGIFAQHQCATETVPDYVPGGLVDHEEDWGPATSDLANDYPWAPGAVRMIVPISDEGPENGENCDDPGSDRDSITQAIADARKANVRVSPIIGTGYSTCVVTLAQALADDTGGRTFLSTNPGADIAGGLIELIGGAVNRSFVTASPTTVVAGGASTITVTIRDVSNQLAAGRKVRLTSSRGPVDTFSPITGTTNTQGQFVATLTSLRSGVAVISATDLTANQPVIGTARVTFGSVTNPPSAAPRIVEVKGDSLLEGLYAQGLGALNNTLRVTVDWQGGAPGTVLFYLNNAVIATKNATGPTVSQTVNFGALRVGTNTLRVLVRNSIGEEARTFIVTGWQVPAWLAVVQNIHPIIQGGYLEFAFKVPGSPLFKGYDANWLLTDRRSTVAIQYGATVRLPIRGGNWEADFTGAFGRNSNTPGRPQKILQNIKFVGSYIDNIEGQIFLGGVVNDQGMAITDFALGYDITFEERVLARATLLELLNAFPPGGTSLYLSLKTIPPVEKAVSMIAEARLGVTPHFKGRFDLVSMSDLDLAGAFSINGDFDLTLSILNGQAEVYGGLGFGVEVKADNTTDYCFIAAADGHVGYTVNLLLWEKSEEYRVELARKTWGQCPALVRLAERGWTAEPISAQPWHIPRAIGGPGYTRYVGALPATPPASGRPDGPQTGDAALAEALLFGNVYSEAKPSLAWAPDGSSGMLVWTHDDLSKPVGQGLEIVSSYYDGTAWSALSYITSDTYPDTGARVTRLADSYYLAVWERIDDPNLPADAPFDATTWSKANVMVALFDPYTLAWSAPYLIHAVNDTLDYAPVLSVTAGDVPLTVWRHNDGNELVGTTASPESLRFTYWNGISWNEGVAAAGLVAVSEVALAQSGGEATLAWTQVMTPTGVLTGTAQVFAVEFDGVAWSAPAQVTVGAIDHYSPQPFYTPAGEAVVAWVEDGAITWRVLSDGSLHTSNLDQAAHEFRLAGNATGNLVAVWTQQDDVFLSLYDWNYDLWSLPANLTRDINRETYLAPFLENGGQLRVAYADTHMSEVIRTVTAASGEVITYTTKIPGITDLSLLSLTPYSDLTVDAIAVTPDAGGVTAAVAVTVANAGYLAAPYPILTVFDGDPDAGGSFIDEVYLDTLAAGITQTITVTNTIDPEAGVRALWAVVDTYDAIAEADEANNRDHVLALGPDLVVESVVARPAAGTVVDLEAVITNVGTAASLPSTMTYHRVSWAGPIVAAADIPSLAPGAATSVLATWEYGALSPGEYLLGVVVNPGAIDFDELPLDNNEYFLNVPVAADLAVDPLYFGSRPGNAGAVVLEATVVNLGAVAAANVPVAFYNTNGQQPIVVATATISNLPAGGSAVATGAWTNPPAQYAAMVVIDPAGQVPDSNRENNAASLTPGFEVVGKVAGVTVVVGTSVTFPVEVRSIGGYSDPIALEALDLPPSGTATVTPASVVPPGAATVEIDIPADAPPAVYPVRVVGVSGERSATVIVNVNVVLALTCYPLTLTVQGQGEPPGLSPERSPSCSVAGEYVAGQAIELTAQPAAGWRVSAWTGTLDDTTPSPVNSAIMPESNHTVGVVYAPLCYSLTLQKEGEGALPIASPNKSFECATNGEYKLGQVITLTAAPAPAWRVSGWRGTGNDMANTTTNQLSMPAADHVTRVVYERYLHWLWLPVLINP